jgi:type IV pilus assembly protein PilV
MKTHTGFTLIEVLIAMLVLAIGLLGLAALQTYTLRSNLDAYNHSQVTQLLYDMADRMRTNSKTVDGNGIVIANTILASYVTTNTLDDPRTKNQTVSSTHNCRKVGTACTAANMVEYDLIEWSNTITGIPLPMGRGCITTTNNINFNIYITWDDNRSGTIDTDIDPPTGCNNFGTKATDTKSHDPIFTLSLQL